MSKKTPNNHVSQFSVKHALEELRSRMVDLEATAHAAEELLQYLPYMPRAPQREADLESDARLNIGRLQSLVVSTASSARTVLQEIDAVIERIYHPTSDNGSSKAGEAWYPRFAMPRDADVASVTPMAMRKRA